MTETTDWNTAEREHRVRFEPTDEDAYRLGQTHQAYGWARTAPGTYCAHHVALYERGFDGKPMEGVSSISRGG